jgi:putative oxidoreductase
MSRHISRQLADATLLLGRLLLAWLFLHEGFELATHFENTLAGMAQLGVAAPIAVAVIVLQLVAGAALLVGWLTWLAALALALFCIATAALFHTDFAIRNELLHFEKDLAIAGGLFAFAASGAGAWSVDGLLRRHG